MSTITLAEEIDIARPAADVWSVVADYGQDPRWRSGVETMAPEPAGLVSTETTTAERLRLAGRTWLTTGRVTAVEPGARFTWRTTGGADAEGARTVTAVSPDRCRVRLDLTVRPRGAERAMAWLLRAMLRRTLAGDARRLRALAERG